MGNLEHALSAYENALRHNSHSLPGLTQVAGIARIKENYPKVRVRTNSNQHRLHVSHLTSITMLSRSICSSAHIYPDSQAVEYFQAALQVQGDNGEVWSALGTSHAILCAQLSFSHSDRALLPYAG